MTSFIVYACPVGPLAEQIETYLKESRRRYGPNAAHAYTPHCTLTGFFQDEKRALPGYASALESALNRHHNQKTNTSVVVGEIVFREDWHGLMLEAEGLKQLIQTFVFLAESPTRSEDLRPKDWLHVSLAYDFLPQDGDRLKQLAIELVDETVPVAWELRLYERDSAQQWTCHCCWPLKRAR
ncbi:MAG: hypothetical protein AAGN15_06795 [Cyanobacteria bacterium J06581_3]